MVNKDNLLKNEDSIYKYIKTENNTNNNYNSKKNINFNRILTEENKSNDNINSHQNENKIHYKKINNFNNNNNKHITKISNKIDLDNYMPNRSIDHKYKNNLNSVKNISESYYHTQKKIQNLH